MSGGGLEQRDSFYAGQVSAEAAELLEAAMQSYGDTARAEALLHQAENLAPDALTVCFSQYKFYFYKGLMTQAEQAVRRALCLSARQSGFVNDYTELTSDSADWHCHDSPAHFYLFSLKALAFIRLRQGDTQTATTILNKISELDHHDTVGSSVIGSLVAAV